MKRFLSADRGALLIEAALVTPFLLIIFIAIAQFAFALYVQASLQTAVRSAVRDVAMKNASVSSGTNTYTCPITPPPASPTIEQIACDYVAQSDLFASIGGFSVITSTYVNDNGTSGQAGDEDDDFIMNRVRISVPLNQVVFIDFAGFLSDSTRTLSAYASMEEEP